jgi:hypothetical protein
MNILEIWKIMALVLVVEFFVLSQVLIFLAIRALREIKR